MTDEETQKQRIETCKLCAHATLDLICNKCGCIIKFKVMLSGSSCPINKW